MKTKTLFSILMSTVMAAAVHGQGSFNFNNIESGTTVTIAPAPNSVNPGNHGDYVGAEYSASFIWGYGTLTSASQLGFTWTGAPVAFFGSTGTDPVNGPTENGAGFFDGGTVPLDTTVGWNTWITIQVQAWYNNGTYATFATAAAAGVNTGVSGLYQVFNGETFLPQGPFPNSAFTVSVSAPEPSTLALAGLGAAALFLFRRRRC